jgi:hypothetical protein
MKIAPRWVCLICLPPHVPGKWERPFLGQWSPAVRGCDATPAPKHKNKFGWPWKFLSKIRVRPQIGSRRWAPNNNRFLPDLEETREPAEEGNLGELLRKGVPDTRPPGLEQTFPSVLSLRMQLSDPSRSFPAAGCRCSKVITVSVSLSLLLIKHKRLGSGERQGYACRDTAGLSRAGRL